MEVISESPIEQMFASAWNDEQIPLEPQYPVGTYYVDFAHVPTRTAIELDGFETHSTREDLAKDHKRERDIKRRGWDVIRFGGKEVYDNVYTCIQETHELLWLRAQFLGYNHIPEPESDPIIPAPPSLSLTHQIASSPLVGWSDFWQGWTIQVNEAEDEIVCGLMLAQLLCTVTAPVYWVRGSQFWSEKDAEVADKYLPPLTLTDQLHYESMSRRRWCQECGQWSRFMLDRAASSWQCLDCSDPATSSVSGDYEVWGGDRWKSTLMMKAQHIWQQRLSDGQRDEVRPYVGSIRSYRPATYLCKLLAGMALVQLRPGEVIKTREMSTFFWQVPWIQEQINRAQWDRFMSIGVSTWITHGWIEKESVGVYRRLVIPVSDKRNHPF